MGTLGIRYRNEYRIVGQTAHIVMLDRQRKPKAETMVSLCDLDRVLAEGRWFQFDDRKKVIGSTETYPYALCTHQRDGKERSVRLHRFIMEAPRGIEVDHINHDTLDNRRENLRLVTKSQNQQNIGGAHRDSRSGVRIPNSEKLPR